MIRTLNRARRALMSVPAHDLRKLSKIGGLGADAVVLDLEDGVPPGAKDTARRQTHALLAEMSAASGERAFEVCVRINALEEGGEHDLHSILAPDSLSAIDALVLPKIESADDVLAVEKILRQATTSPPRLLLAIESAKGVLALGSIAHASPLADALIFASEDYCADVGATRTPAGAEMAFARSSIVLHAVAARLQPIDMVCIDYRDDSQLTRECVDGAALGFRGKQTIHPRQIPIVQAHFAPNASEISRAKEIVRLFEEHASKGIGAFDYEGIVVDAPVYKHAQRLLQRSQY